MGCEGGECVGLFRVQAGQHIAGGDGVAGLFVEDDAGGGVDRILYGTAAGPEGHGGMAQGKRVEVGDVAFGMVRRSYRAGWC